MDGGIPIVADRRLAAAHLGKLEGARKNDPEFIAAYQGEDRPLPGGGKSQAQVVARVAELIEELPALCPQEDILLVTQGRIYRTMKALFDEQADAMRLSGKVGNCEVLCFETER